MSSVQNAIIRNKMKIKSTANKSSVSKKEKKSESIKKTESSKKNSSSSKHKKINQSLEQNDEKNINGMEDHRQFYLNLEKQNFTSSNVMTKYEKAAVLGKRAQQIACGAIPLIKVSSNLNNAVDIAEEELKQKKNPYIIERDLGNGKKEYIKVREMIIY